jgi:dolichol-phosphate mannosyltransferase
MRFLVIIPTYNERDNLVPLLDAVLAVDPLIDVLVVDDNSPDGTGELADAFATATDRVRVLHRSGKQGLGTAYIAGFRVALARGYERVVEMDADFSHRPEDLPRLLDAAGHADVVIGSRNIPGGRVIGWSALRQVISKGGSLVARVVLGLPVHDCTSGFKCFRRAALQALDLDAIRSNGYAFQVEVNFACTRAGLRLVEIPIVFPDRTRGHSKMSGRILAEAAVLLLRLRLGLARPPLALALDGPESQLHEDVGLPFGETPQQTTVSAPGPSVARGAVATSQRAA